MQGAGFNGVHFNISFGQLSRLLHGQQDNGRIQTKKNGPGCNEVAKKIKPFGSPSFYSKRSKAQQQWIKPERIITFSMKIEQDGNHPEICPGQENVSPAGP